MKFPRPTNCGALIMSQRQVLATRLIPRGNATQMVRPRVRGMMKIQPQNLWLLSMDPFLFIVILSSPAGEARDRVASRDDPCAERES